MTRTHVLLMGHSFVRRLGKQRLDIGIDLERSFVEYCGQINNQPLNFIEELVKFLPNFRQEYLIPDVLVLMLGSNDLCSFPYESAMGLGLRLAAVGKWFLKNGVKRIVFTEVLPRLGDRAFRPCPQFLRHQDGRMKTIGEAEEEFTMRASEFNCIVWFFCKANGECSLLKWRGLHRRMRSQLIDGIHLSGQGMEKLRRSLKRALIVNLQRCGSDN